MRNIPSPENIALFDLRESAAHQGRVDTIVDRFIAAVKTGDFHYISTDKEAVVQYPAEGDYCKKVAFDDAVLALKSEGWDVWYDVRICAHGWFHAIMLNR